jgi:hypothetical protein
VEKYHYQLEAEEESVSTENRINDNKCVQEEL